MSNYHWGFGIEHEFSTTFSKKIIITLNDLLNYFNNIGNKQLLNKIEKTFKIKMINSPISEIKEKIIKNYSITDISKCMNILEPHLILLNIYDNNDDLLYYKILNKLIDNYLVENLKKNKKITFRNKSIIKSAIINISINIILEKKKVKSLNDLKKLIKKYNYLSDKYYPTLILQIFFYLLQNDYIITEFYLFFETIDNRYNIKFIDLIFIYDKLLKAFKLNNLLSKFIKNFYVFSIKENKNTLCKLLYNYIKDTKIKKKYYNEANTIMNVYKLKKTNKYYSWSLNGGTKIHNINNIKKYFKKKIDLKTNIIPVFILNDFGKKLNIYKDFLLKKKNYFKLYLTKLKFNTIYNTLNTNDLKYSIYLSENGLPELDYGNDYNLFEIKTLKYLNKTTKKIIYELNKIERIILKIFNSYNINYIDNKLLGDINITDIGNFYNVHDVKLSDNDYTLKKRSKYDYLGSYHIWVTIPYLPKTPPKIFVKQHVKFASLIQLLEPLFAGIYMSGDARMIGKKFKYSSSSYRGIINHLSGYGTTNIRSLFGIDTSTIYSYYLSLNDLINYKVQPIIDPSNLYKKIYDNNGNIIKNYNMCNRRFLTNPIFNSCYSSNSLTQFLNKNNNNKNINTYIDILKNKVRFYADVINKRGILKYGADIRTFNWENNIVPPLKKGWISANIIDGKKFKRVYYKKVPQKTKPYKYSYDPPYDMNAFKKILFNKRHGIEIRFFDNMDSKYMKNILDIISLIIVISKVDTNITYHTDYQYWHDAMAETLIDGYTASMPEKYIDVLRKEFKITLRSTIIEDVYLELITNIYEKYKNNKIFKLITNNTKVPKINNVNRMHWNNMFYNKLKSCPDLNKSFEKIITLYLNGNYNTDISELIKKYMGNKWMPYSLKIYNYINDLIKKNVI